MAPFERGEIGPDLFRVAAWASRIWCPSIATGPYHGGRQKHWIKVKNRSHPAMERELCHQPISDSQIRRVQKLFWLGLV